MDSRISWKKAYGGSLVIHALVFGLFMCFLASSVAHHEEEKMYVIDLDASELTGAGSGHAGGGGGAADLFPDKLSDAAVAERRAQVEQASSALAAPSAISPVESAAANPSPTNSASSDGGSSAAGGEGSGSGSGSGSGEGSGSGSGYGSGSGSGSGDGMVTEKATAKEAAVVRAAATAAVTVRVPAPLIPTAFGPPSMPIKPILPWL